MFAGRYTIIFLKEHENPVIEDFVKQLISKKKKKLSCQTLKKLSVDVKAQPVKEKEDTRRKVKSIME